MEKEANYDSAVVGTVSEVKVLGLNFPTLITVEYVADGRPYSVTETLKLKNKTIKLGFIPIGQKKVPAMGDVRIGTKVDVLYQSYDPSKAVIRENQGKQNI